MTECTQTAPTLVPASVRKDSDSEPSFDESDKSGSEDGDEDLARERRGENWGMASSNHWQCWNFKSLVL